MALNVQALANRLKEFEDGAKASEFAKLLWKPKEGLQTIRIVPYKFNPENPFIELKFYYKLAGNNYLAPCTFGKPDPIQEVVETLRSSGSNEEKEIAAKLAPTPRTYVPIIVRGEEELGVRFWGFGVQVYKELLSYMTNPKWGDITSLADGNDLDVEFHKESKKKGKDGKSFPETKIMPCPQKTPVVEPTRKDLLEKVKNQTDILTIFPLKSYDELKAAVNKWLNPETDAPAASNPTQEGGNTPTEAPAKPAASPAPLSESQKGAVAEEFDKFFNS